MTLHEKTAAGPSSWPLSISGCIPGLLDPTQRQRLLRSPGSRLSFAAFNPLVASSHADSTKTPSLHDKSYRPKRIVIETLSNGEQFWRFVPRPRFEDSALDEGQWPRIVSICGREIECSQDQWDIYKLDPFYDCYVRLPPSLTVITFSPPTPDDKSYIPGDKRSIPASPSPSQETCRHAKKANFVSPQFNDSDQDELEGMLVDDDSSRLATGRAKKFREEVKKNRAQRREKSSRRAEKLSQNELEENRVFDFTSQQRQSQSVPPEVGKRKVSDRVESLSPQGPDDEETPRKGTFWEEGRKRTRTVSPSFVKRKLMAKRQERERRKKARRDKDLHVRRQSRENSFLRRVYADLPVTAEDEDIAMQSASQQTAEESPDDSDNNESSDSEDLPEEREDTPDTEEAAREAAIAESRRKLAELEADRPLWEAQARIREQRGREEAETLRREAEERRRSQAQQQQQAEAELLAKARREAQAKEEAQRKEREAAARRERERRQRNQKWSFGPWNNQRALERYKALCEYFDSAKFSQDNPLTFEDVPWPVVDPPGTLRVENIDWAAVEKFFKAVRPYMRPQEFRMFVEKSHRRFHPDRWRSRNLLKNVMDDSERDCMEVASNTVAQALTPIWRELTGR